jgi:hypothetical protein
MWRFMSFNPLPTWVPNLLFPEPPHAGNGHVFALFCGNFSHPGAGCNTYPTAARINPWLWLTGRRTRHTLGVIARLDRAIQSLRDEMDAPLARGMTPECARAVCLEAPELIPLYIFSGR